MSLTIHKTGRFVADADEKFEWYLTEAGESIAWRLENAIDATLRLLSGNPAMGHACAFRRIELRGLRSFRVEPPFEKLLVFYRVEGKALVAWRLMHGARDLPRRLIE